MSRWLRFRVQLDRLLAALFLVPIAPVLGVLAVLVRRDGGPSFVRVPRIGRRGVLMAMWKLRTMRATSPGGLAGGSDLTARDDDRVTPIGRHLRRLHIDELSQLVNVARGEMSLLGPRPEAPGYVDLGDDRWQLILSAPPGIGGPTQVLVNRWEAEVLDADRGQTVYRSTILPVKVAIDAWYVANSTPGVDMLVLIAVLTGRTKRLRRRAERAVPELTVVP